MTNFEIYMWLRNEESDISENGFGIIDELHYRFYECPYSEYVGACIHMMLIRLRKEFAPVYAITIGQFLEFESFVESGKDPEGNTILLPKYGSDAEIYASKQWMRKNKSRKV